MRCCLGLALAVAAVAAGGSSDADVSKKNRSRILIVPSGKQTPYQEAGAAAEAALTREGHVVKSIQLAELEKTASSLTGAEQDVFLAVGSQAAVRLHQRVRPPARLIYCMVARPEFLGLTEAPPALGVRTDIRAADQVRVIAEALPKARSIGTLYRSDQAKSVALFEGVKACLPQGWRLEAVAVDKQASLAEAIEALMDRKVDVVWTAPDPSVYDVATLRALLLSAIRRKTPVFGFSAAIVRAGACLGVGVAARTQGEQAAELIERLLDPPPAVPASQPDAQAAAAGESPRFEVYVNLIVARQLELDIPAEFIQRADQVIRPREEKP